MTLLGRIFQRRGELQFAPTFLTYGGGRYKIRIGFDLGKNLIQ